MTCAASNDDSYIQNQFTRNSTSINHFNTNHMATKKQARGLLEGQSFHDSPVAARLKRRLPRRIRLLPSVGKLSVSYHTHDPGALVKALMIGFGDVEHPVGHDQILRTFERIAQRGAKFRRTRLGARLERAPYRRIEQYPGAIRVAGEL